MATIEELEARLAEIEARLGPVPLAVPPITIGELTTVPAPGSPVASAWAQQVSARVLHRFANAAARNAAFPSPVEGLECFLLDIHAWQLYDGAQWIEPGRQTLISLPLSAGMTNGQTITGSGFTVLSQRRRYHIAISANVFKGGAAGGVTITPTGTGFTPAQVALVTNLGTPESRTLYGAWSFNPTSSPAGAFTMGLTAGTADVAAGSTITITDVGSI